jgi:hypothetical protein
MFESLAVAWCVTDFAHFRAHMCSFRLGFCYTRFAHQRRKRDDELTKVGMLANLKVTGPKNLINNVHQNSASL